MKETSYLQGRTDLIEKFSRLPFLRPFSKDQITEILKLSKIRRYDAGETIITEGTMDVWIYILISGEVRVSRKGKVLSTLDQAGDPFGEMSAIDGEPRSATVYAARDTTCLAMDASFLERTELKDRNILFAIFYRMLAEILASRLRVMNEKFVQIKDDLELLRLTTYEWDQPER